MRRAAQRRFIALHLLKRTAMHYELAFKGNCVAYFFGQNLGAIAVKFLFKLGH